MKKQKGITLVEVIMCMAMLAIFGMVLVGQIKGTGTPEMSFGYNGAAETRCISGYAVLVGANGSPTQLLDENGKGIKCK